MIEIKNLRKVYDNGVCALDNLNLFIEPGITGLIGHNGAGKSTLLRIISGIVYPTEGNVLVDGVDSLEENAKKKVFFLPDIPLLPKQKSHIKDVFNFYSQFYDINKEKYFNLVKSLNLPLDKKVLSFSKGMQRQTFLCLALSINCDVLILDEAFDGIDPIIMEIMKEQFVAFAKEGKTIIASSHNLGTLESIATKFIILNKGKLSDKGTEKDLSVSYVKYQILLKEGTSGGVFDTLPLRIIQRKEVGSITQLVLEEQEDIDKILKEKLKPVICDKIPLDRDELLKLELLNAKETK